MCTLLASFNPGISLTIGFNRDERVNRPSEGWKWRDNQFTPLDNVFGGTWIGVNKSGIFAALTNYDIDYTRQAYTSRGFIVQDILSSCYDDEDVNGYILNGYLKSKKYKPFNVFIGSSNFLYRVGIDNKGEEIYEKLSAGLNISAGWGVNDQVWSQQRGKNIKNFLLSYNDVSLKVMAKVMALHDDGTEDTDVCVHDPKTTHVTVSSGLIRIANEIEVYSLVGHPCENQYKKELY